MLSCYLLTLLFSFQYLYVCTLQLLFLNPGFPDDPCFDNLASACSFTFLILPGCTLQAFSQLLLKA